jgi:hypothetical protein
MVAGQESAGAASGTRPQRGLTGALLDTATSGALIKIRGCDGPVSLECVVQLSLHRRETRGESDVPRRPAQAPEDFAEGLFLAGP